MLDVALLEPVPDDPLEPALVVESEAELEDGLSPDSDFESLEAVLDPASPDDEAVLLADP